MLANAALGLAGEAGEVADHIKKHLYHGHALLPDALVLELGDVLFYVQLLCNAIGVSMDDVITRNEAKLKERYPNGFSSEASINRKDMK